MLTLDKLTNRGSGYALAFRVNTYGGYFHLMRPANNYLLVTIPRRPESFINALSEALKLDHDCAPTCEIEFSIPGYTSYGSVHLDGYVEYVPDNKNPFNLSIEEGERFEIILSVAGVELQSLRQHVDWFYDLKNT